MNQLVKNLLEVEYKGIVRKQKSISRLFPDWKDKVKGIKDKGGLRLRDQKPDEWFFKVHSGTKSGVWYDVHLRFKNVRELLKEHVRNRKLWKKDRSGVDRRKLAKEILYNSDLELSCSCPAQLYYGGAYITSLSKYDAKYGDKETRPPKIRNPKQYGMVCKHLQNVINVLPFYEGTMAKWLTKFYDKDIKEIEEVAKEELGFIKKAARELGKREESREALSFKDFRKDVYRLFKLNKDVVLDDVQKLLPEVEVRSVSLSGSYGRLHPSKGSDIDVKVVYRGDLDRDEVWDRLTGEVTIPGVPGVVDIHVERIEVGEARGYWRDWTEVVCPRCSWRDYRKNLRRKDSKILKTMRCPECGAKLIIREKVEEEMIKERNIPRIISYTPAYGGIIKVMSSSGKRYSYSGVSPHLYNEIERLLKYNKYGTVWQLLRKLEKNEVGQSTR